MSYSRRSMVIAGSLAALGCVTLRRSAPPEGWREVPFGRHAVDAPGDLIKKLRTVVALGALTGEEYEDLSRTHELLERIEDQTQRMLVLSPQPNYSVSRSSFEHKGAEIDILGLHWNVVDEVQFSARLLIKTGTLPIVFHGPIRAASETEAAANVRALVDSIAPRASASHANPFCTPSYSIDIAPRLGQRIYVSMAANDDRVLMVDSAYVRHRERREEGAPVFARDSLAYARATSVQGGTGVANVHVRRRMLKVADMIAPEVVWTTNQGRSGLLHFAWIHLGVAHDAKKPYISIYFSGDLASASRRELNQQWKAILGSLRLLPN